MALCLPSRSFHHQGPFDIWIGKRIGLVNARGRKLGDDGSLTSRLEPVERIGFGSRVTLIIISIFELPTTRILAFIIRQVLLVVRPDAGNNLSYHRSNTDILLA